MPQTKLHIKTIAIFIPVPYQGGTLNGAKNIAKMLHLGSRANNEPINVVFSCIDGYYNIEKDFSDLHELNIPVRKTTWKRISKNELKLFPTINAQNYIDEKDYLLPVAENKHFQDCDFWLMISDRFDAPIAPIRPYAMVIYDYIQRYFPSIFPSDFSDISYIKAARAAKFVLVTTPGTYNDAVQYAGIAAERVHLAPMEFNPFKEEPHSLGDAKKYFIWPTNTTAHKNHLTAVEALDIYYSKLQGSFQVLATGYDTQLLNMKKRSLKGVHPYVRQVNRCVQQKELVAKNLIAKGNCNLQEYISLLAGAKFLWHPALIDNGTYTVVEAAYYGVPSLSHDYPQMQYINQRFQLNLNFTDATNAKNMAIQLKNMEESYFEKAKILPQRNFLQQFGFMKLAAEYWSLFRSLL